MVQWLRLHTSTAEHMGGGSLVGELRSYMLFGTAKNDNNYYYLKINV